MNNVVLMGRLTKDPEIRYLSAGHPVANFTLAVDRNLSKEQKAEYESKNIPIVDFVQCQAWGKNAENIGKFTSKGKRVLIAGRIQSGSYVGQDGVRKYFTNVTASTVEFIDWNTSNKEEDEYCDFSYSPQFDPVSDDGRIPF